jgi:trigger factor
VKGETEKLNIQTERTEDCQIRLTIEVDQDRVDRHLKGAARRIASKVRIPGFRKGKAPYDMIVRTLGKEALYEEALEELGQEVFSEALEKEDIQPYSQGQLEDVSFDPMILKFVVPLPPEVELNDYREIRVEPEEVVVTDEEVDQAIEQLREEKAEWKTVERPLAENDRAVTHVKVSSDEETLDDDDRTFVIDTEHDHPVPGFQGAILGIIAGETRNFDLTYPEDWQDETLAGRMVHFEVELKEVQEEVLPELNDEFAILVGDYDSLEDLTAQVSENLEAQAKLAAAHRLENEAVDKLVEGAVITFPSVMLEDSLDSIIDEQDSMIRRQQGVSLEDFLKMTGQSMDDLRANLNEAAEARLKRALSMGKLTELERLVVSDEEIQSQGQVMLAVFQGAPNEIQEFLATPQGQEAIRREALTRKARERLVAIAKGEAPEIELDEPGELLAASTDAEPEGTPEDTLPEEVGETEDTSETFEDEPV